MSDLISREAVLGVLKQLAEVAQITRDALIDLARIGAGLPELEEARCREALRAAHHAGRESAFTDCGTAIRALPADDRRCENCKFWCGATGGKYGECDSLVNAQTNAYPPEYPPAHFCSAHQPKEDA